MFNCLDVLLFTSFQISAPSCGTKLENAEKLLNFSPDEGAELRKLMNNIEILAVGQKTLLGKTLRNNFLLVI